MTAPRVIVYAKPEEYIYVGHVARIIAADTYQWPEDGIAIFGFGNDFKGPSFAAKRNKSGFTIYSQQLERHR